MEVSGQLQAPSRFTPGKEPRAEWDPEPVWTRWREEKILSPAENRTSVLQPVA